MHAIGVVAKLHPSKTERLFNEAFTTKEHSSSSSIASLLVYPKRVPLHLAAGLLINTCWSTEMIMMLLHPAMEMLLTVIEVVYVNVLDVIGERVFFVCFYFVLFCF